MITYLLFILAGNVVTWSLLEWEQRIARNFEARFWVGNPEDTNERRPDLVHRRGIYKDVVGASQEWTDYQLRCNFPIALVVVSFLYFIKLDSGLSKHPA